MGPNRVLIAVSSGSTITGAGQLHVLPVPARPAVRWRPDQRLRRLPHPGRGRERALHRREHLQPTTARPSWARPATWSASPTCSSGTLTVTAFRNIARSTGRQRPLDAAGSEQRRPGRDRGLLHRRGHHGLQPVGHPARHEPRRRRRPSPGNINLTVPTTVLPQRSPPRGHRPPSTPWTTGCSPRPSREGQDHGREHAVDRPQHRGERERRGERTGDRNGSRWYQIGSLTTTPALVQSGTLFDPAATNPRGYWIPSVAMSGQGHMVAREPAPRAP